jgi:hypothetical protein
VFITRIAPYGSDANWESSRTLCEIEKYDKVYEKSQPLRESKGREVVRESPVRREIEAARMLKVRGIAKAVIQIRRRKQMKEITWRKNHS